ncbi:hypothetical protein, partial [Ralstonia solanacearum]|uniref:hypothetical protein n=1 Tax=Ralstonia solanacearum TaxID=305 RepID=UPI0023068C21
MIAAQLSNVPRHRKKEKSVVQGEVFVQLEHRPAQLAALLGLCAVFIPPMAHAAGIVPDGGTATTVTTGTNGRPVV